MVKDEKFQLLSHASTFWRMKIKKVFPLVKTLGWFQKRGTPKWMVKIMENPTKMDDLGGFPPIFGSTPTLILGDCLQNRSIGPQKNDQVVQTATQGSHPTAHQVITYGSQHREDQLGQIQRYLVTQAPKRQGGNNQGIGKDVGPRSQRNPVMGKPYISPILRGYLRVIPKNPKILSLEATLSDFKHIRIVVASFPS